MARNVCVRARLTLVGVAVGALLGACNGSDSDSGPASSGASMLRASYGGGPWGSRAYRSSAGSSSSASSSASPGSGGSPGTVTLSWEAPTENTNGTPLTNLAGFYIHYGIKVGDYTDTIQIANPSVTSYVVDNLSRGTYYFVLTAYTVAGEDSGYSSQVSATVE